MLRRRPGAAIFFGVTNIVVGALGLMVYGCCGFMVFAMAIDPSGGRSVWSHLAADVPLYAPLTIAHLVLSLLLCLLLLIAGIGLLGMHNWARLFSVACGVVALVLNIGIIIFQAAFVSPSLQRFFPGPESAALAAATNFYTTGIAAIAILYCAALLITLLLPDVAAAFQHEPPPAWADDFDDDRPRRRRPRDDDWDD
jgi:hypothetical protein